MDSRQKEVQQAHLDEEKRVIRKLKQVYKQASKDCEEKIQALASRTDMQNLQSIVYQQQYQQALKTQIDGVLDALQTNEFDSVAEYLTTCYENGYVGAMYTLHGQGIPVITPIDQTQVVNAVQTESKLSENLYTRLGEDTGKLKKSIQSEMSRGIANGSTWLEIAQKIASGMNSPFKKALNNAIRIVRTEGGRIISQANLDAAYEARENGADSVKQWNATLDGRTRPDHRAADGQIVELDEYFTVGGEKMKAPCIGGSARNVCNCRCCMDMIPRWTLDEYALQRLKDRAAFFGLDKTKDFEAFREKYLQAAGEGGIVKAITLEDIELADKGGDISEDCKKVIADTLQSQMMKSGGFYYDDVKVVNIPQKAGGGLEVLRTNAVSKGTYADVVLEINKAAFSGASKQEIDDMFEGAKNTVCNSLEDAVIHEIGHAKTIYNRTFANYARINEELASVHKTGISKLAELDGLECIAECEVLLNRGETLSDELMEFYQTYTTGGG